MMGERGQRVINAVLADAQLVYTVQHFDLIGTRTHICALLRLPMLFDSLCEMRCLKAHETLTGQEVRDE
jgi:hypothetical protein